MGCGGTACNGFGSSLTTNKGDTMRVYSLHGFKFDRKGARKIAPPNAFVEVPEDEGRRLIEAGAAELATEKNERVEKPKKAAEKPKGNLAQKLEKVAEKVAPKAPEKADKPAKVEG